MRKLSFSVLTLCLFVAVASAQAQQQNTYYVFNGKTLEVTHDNPAHANYMQWQVWLFQDGVHIPHYTAGLRYSRWGLIEGTSAGSVMKRLKASQSFEEAYLKFFGSGTWGQYTFFNPVGPIAVTDQAIETQPAGLEELYQLRGLYGRLNKVITAVQPSLENNESEGPGSPLKEYFDQIRDALERVSKTYSQLARIRPQLRFIDSQIAQAKSAVAEAENNVPKITAALPSVKLPTSKVWMSHTERAGSDGTIQVAVMETGSGVSVQQTWTGGDGSMAGTVILTTIPYDDIGNIDFEPPTRIGDNTWTFRVHSARTSFPQSVNSPQRKTAKATLPAVSYTTAERAVYFTFLNSAEAQDAYAYFLYHKQLGR
jgi:hypothetical protein